jgi:3-oxoacyl-[acyl-carrier-protein] synthase II
MSTNDRRRVVITGMGLITALGNDVETNWAAMLEGRSGIRRIEAFDPSRVASQIGGEVRDFDASHVLDRKELRRTDRYIAFGLVGARQAMDQAGLPGRLEGEEAERTGVILGTGLGGVGTLVDGITTNALRGPDRISPFLVPMGIPNVGAGQVAINFGMTGPNFTTVSACATGGHAIGEATETIIRDDADIMIAGGTEAGIFEPMVGGFASMRALSTRNDEPATASRPFDLDRDGFIMGEGSGVVILEELEFARRRGAPIYAELVGYGMSADAFHITAPSEDGEGGMRVMTSALDDAGVTPAQVDYINAHGTSTPYNDRLETLAIRRLFGEHAAKLAISSTKSMTGHLLGAAGGLEAGITALAIKHQLVPPTINYRTPDPECDLDYVPNTARPMNITYALSNSFGFGGTNGALLFKKFDA